MATIMKVYNTVDARLSQLSVKDGNLIFTTDTRRIYLDMNGNRLGYDTIQIFDKDSDRIAVLAPVEGFYFVRETGVLWNVTTGQWKQMTPSNLQQVSFGMSREDFPKVGNPNVLYVANDTIYKWDSLLHDYVIVSNKTEWKNL